MKKKAVANQKLMLDISHVRQSFHWSRYCTRDWPERVAVLGYLTRNMKSCEFAYIILKNSLQLRPFDAVDQLWRTQLQAATTPLKSLKYPSLDFFLFLCIDSFV